MARNILRAGFPLVVHNRTRSKEASLVSAGALSAASPSEAAAQSDVVCLCLSDTPDVEHVLFGEAGVASAARSGTVVIDHSTISPSVTASFAERLRKQDVELIDAPVSGGTEGAIAGTLAVMCGGRREAFDKVRPVLDAVGKTVTLVGGSGAGQATKAVNQTILAGAYLGLAEAIALGEALNLDLDKVLVAIGSGSAKSWVLEHRSANMRADSYPLGFKVTLHRKDLGIVLEEASARGLDLDLVKLVTQVEDRLETLGYGDEDVSAVARIAKLRRSDIGE